jgi:copper chaperone
MIFITETDMETLTLKISGMTCGGCINSIRKAVGAMQGIGSVEASLERADATVVYDPLLSSATAIKTTIRDAGFETD